MNKTKYITVTRAIPKPEGLSKVHPDVLDHASERGKKAHAAVNGYCYSLQNPASMHWSPPIDEEIIPYFESGKQWIDFYLRILYCSLFISCQLSRPVPFLILNWCLEIYYRGMYVTAEDCYQVRMPQI